MAKRNATEVATGAVVLLVAAGFLGYAVASTGAGGGSGGYALHARFSSIEGLDVGSDVRMAGVKVGTVTAAAIDPSTYLADVTFSVQPGIELPQDSSATVASSGLLGGKYLALSPGGAEKMLPPGGTVTITQGAVNLEDLLGKFIFSASSLASGGKGGSGAASGSASGGTSGGGGVGGLGPLK